MPEEINRVVTDRLSDVLLTPSRDAGDNLVAEGIPADRVHFVGNVMIDSLCWALPQAEKRDVPAHYDVVGAGYAVVTLHRPANVDDPAVLRELLETLDQISRKLTVLFPVHPARASACTRSASSGTRAAGCVCSNRSSTSI